MNSSAQRPFKPAPDSEGSAVTPAKTLISEHRTGPSHQRLLPEGQLADALASSGLHPSVTPESLRRPYASLAPQSRLGAESTPISVERVVPRLSMRPTPARSSCRKHKIAKGDNGDCMLCAKEEAESRSLLAWKLLLAFVFVAGLGAGLAVVLR